MESDNVCKFPIRKVPSLQHISLVSVAFLISDFTKMRDECAEKLSKKKVQSAKPELIYDFQLFPKGLRELTLDALKKLDGSLIPDLVKEKLSSVLILFYLEILRFLNLNKFLLCTKVDVKKYIVMYQDGLINHSKSHQKIIKNPLIDNRIRFVSACCICSENDIYHLWNNMTESEVAFYKTPNVGYNVYTPPLVMLWRDFLQNGEVDWPSDVLFFISILQYSKAGYYIINKLPLERRKQAIIQCLKFALTVSIDVDFWMECLDDEQKREFIENEIFLILGSYIPWPRRIYIIDAANLSWQYLKPREFFSVLFVIHKGIESGLKYFDDIDTFFDLCNACPDEYIKGWDIEGELNRIRNAVTKSIQNKETRNITNLSFKRIKEGVVEALVSLI